MKIDPRTPVSRVAADVPGAMAVLEAAGIEYACAGEQSLEDAAHAAGLDPVAIVASLRHLNSLNQGESWNDRTLVELQKYLVGEHHRFLRDELAVIAMRLAEFCSSPAPHKPDLQSLRSAFTKLSSILLPHMQNEEHSVFPAIEALESSWQTNQPSTPPDAEFHAMISRLVAEHGTVTALLRTIRELRLRLLESNEPSECRPVLVKVAALEAHLHQYMFLENCVLFPRAVALEKQLPTPH